MADDRQATSAAGGARGYKRSWKNLLINKRYQLRFTLFMVLVAALLMTGLGIWVMRVANEATEVAESRVRGELCEPLPELKVPPPAVAPPAPAPAPEPTPPPADAPAAPGGAPSPDEAPDEAPADPEQPAEPAADGDEDGGRRRVVIEESSMTISQLPADPLPDGFAQAVAAHYTCELKQAARLDDLARGRMRIFYVLIGAGLLLTIGLAVYGIKMTHKVAGPLYKVTLYMGKMRDGRYDKVYNLRKGDQLVAFYEHFRAAHAGVVALEQADIDRLRAVIAAAEAAGVAGTSPEVDAALGELRAILARKEKSLE